jgi:hypothetical protein
MTLLTAAPEVRSTALRRVAKWPIHHIYASASPTPPRLVYRSFMLSHPGASVRLFARSSLLIIGLLFAPDGLLQAEPLPELHPGWLAQAPANLRDLVEMHEEENEEAEKAEAEAETEDDQEEDEEEPGFFDITHEKVSEAILASANWIDSFFSDERTIREETETRLRFGVSNFSEKSDLLQADLHTSFRLDLPVFSERLHLLISGEEDDDETEERRRPARPATRREREPSVSIRYFLLMSLRRNASISTGVRFRDGSPVFLFEPRYRQVFPVGDWDLRFTQRFTAYTDETLRIRTSFDLERPIGNKYFFRNTAEGIWFRDQPGYFYNFHVTLFQPISRDRMLQYQWSNKFITRPDHVLDEIRLIFSFRQRFWREWLFYEVSPQIAYPRKEDYEFSPGIMLRLDIIFGDFSSFRIHQF